MPMPVRLRQIIATLVMGVLCATVFSSMVLAARPPVAAQAYCLMDAATGKVLLGRNMHRQLYPASITKIMTALVALELGRLADEVRISPQAARTEGSSMYLSSGETLTLDTLLYGLLLESGNDAAEAIAEHVAESVPEFAKLMNETARGLGARSTHFMNPHGLPNPEHVTTAYDMALIARRAMQLPAFRRIVATRKKEISATSQGRARILYNGNWLLGNDGIDGIKTGYTIAARHTYVASALRDGRRLIAVVLSTYPRSQKWKDAQALLEYGFKHYIWEEVVGERQWIQSVPVQESEIATLPLVAIWGVDVPHSPGVEPDVSWELKDVKPLVAPVEEGEIVGNLQVYVDGNPATEIPLLAGIAARVPLPESWWYRFRRSIRQWLGFGQRGR